MQHLKFDTSMAVNDCRNHVTWLLLCVAFSPFQQGSTYLAWGAIIINFMKTKACAFIFYLYASQFFLLSKGSQASSFTKLAMTVLANVMNNIIVNMTNGHSPSP